MGELADLHFGLKAKLKLAKDKVKEIEDQMGKLEAEAIELSKEQKNKICRGRQADGVVEVHDHYNIKDFNVLWNWSRKTGEFVFQRRIGAEAYRDLVEAGQGPPGISIFKEDVFKTKKRGGKK